MRVVYLRLFIAMGWMYLRLPTSFLPDEDQGYVVANIELPSGATANRAMDVIKKVEEYFMALPQMQNIVAVQGFSFNGNGLRSEERRLGKECGGTCSIRGASYY